MGLADSKDLEKFLKEFPEEIRAMALWLRTWVWKQFPDSTELIYDNYNALAFGWSTSDRAGNVFCSIAVFGKHLNFGFYWGAFIKDPEKKLIGAGKQYRYIKVTDLAAFPKTYMRKLLKEAYSFSLSKMKTSSPEAKGKTMTKAVAPVRRRQGKTKGKKK